MNDLHLPEHCSALNDKEKFCFSCHPDVPCFNECCRDLNQFLTPWNNRRRDEWGGSLENRARLLLEIVREVRAEVGPDFPVIVKIDSREVGKEGGITILVGGEKEVFEAQLPVLQVIGGKILHMGPLGSASVVKVITNLLALGHLILAGEAFMLGKKAGIDLTALFEGIKASSGNSYTIETELPLVYNGSYDVGFSLALACKDLGLAHELGRDHGVPLEIGGLIEQIFIRAKTQYGDDKNSTQAVKLLEDALNDYLRAAGY